MHSLAGMSTGAFPALTALKTSSNSNSPCTSVLQAAMMVPELSTFVTTVQVRPLYSGIYRLSVLKKCYQLDLLVVQHASWGLLLSNTNCCLILV